MKKLLVILLGASLSLAQTGGSTGGKPVSTEKVPAAETGKKGKAKTKSQSHKGGKKSNKGLNPQPLPPKPPAPDKTIPK